MSLYRDPAYRATVPNFRFYGPRSFESKLSTQYPYNGQKYTISSEQNATISQSIEKISYASFFTKDIHGDMIPADANTSMENLYYGTCIQDFHPWNCFENPKDIEDAKNGFINTRSFKGNFSFYTLKYLPYLKFINVIPNGESSLFKTGDIVAVGENGRVDKFTDSNTQKALPLKIEYKEHQDDINQRLLVLVLVYNS